MKVGDKVEYYSKMKAWTDKGNGIIVSISGDVVGVKVSHGISYMRKENIKKIKDS